MLDPLWASRLGKVMPFGNPSLRMWKRQIRDLVKLYSLRKDGPLELETGGRSRKQP